MRRSSRRFSRSQLALAVTALVVAACGGGEAAPPSTQIPTEVVAEGEDLYAANCAECHGIDLAGTDRGPSHLSVVYEPGHHADAAFLLAVRNGVRPHHWDFGPMPPIEGLTDEEVGAITAYVRSVQAERGFQPYP